MSLQSRLRRHLSFANLVACMALFVALGGSAYAASQINGKNIVKQSIGGGKLKNGTITSRQIKKNSLNSSVIDLSTLATVPTAQSAVTAQSAGTATTANSATTATTAQSATKATSAETAQSATTAGTATNASHADLADLATKAEAADHADTAATADTADVADNANSAAHADEADLLEGKSAADLTDTCPANTTLFGGMCWDDQPRVSATWIAAATQCASLQGRLPSLSELVAYLLKPGEQADSPNWSSEVVDLASGDEQVVVADEGGRSIKSGGLFAAKYRCLFYRTNAG